MALNRDTLRKVFLGKAVWAVFVLFAVVWILAWNSSFPESFYAVLYPLWMPGYLAVLLTTALRNSYLPWFGSGLLFGVAVFLVLYLEAVVVSSVYYTLRHIYRTYRRGQERNASA